MAARSVPRARDSPALGDKLSRRILIATYSVPGRGGAATAAYQLFARLQRDGFDVAYLSIIDEKNEAEYRREPGERMANPSGLANVWWCRMRRPIQGPHPEVSAVIDQIAPDVALGVSHQGALLSKAARPQMPVIYFACGSADVCQQLIARPGIDALGLLRGIEAGESLRILSEKDVRAIQAADLVIANSELLRNFCVALYPEYADKLHDDVIGMADWITDRALEHAERARPFEERDIDALFIATRWSRPEKNFPFVRDIAAALPDRNLHVVGHLDAPLAGATCHGFVGDPAELFDLMGRAKVVACPSRFDAAPGILFEAAVLGCNVVASDNCGNANLCNEQLRVHDFTAAAFVQAIERGLENPLPSHLEDHSYDRFKEILADFPLGDERAEPDLDALREQLADPDRGYAVLRGFLSSEEVEHYRSECSRFFERGPVVHQRINRGDMFDYVHPRYQDPDGKIWSTKDSRRIANILRIYQFSHNRHSAPTARLFQRVLDLRNLLEEPWQSDEAYCQELEELSDYIQATKLLEDNHGVRRHRDSKRDLAHPVLQPLMLLSEPGLDFEGGDVLIHSRSGRVAHVIADEALRKGDLVFFDRRLEHEVEATTSSGRTGRGRWSVVIGARDRQVGTYLDRYRFSAFWVSKVSPITTRLRKAPRRLRSSAMVIPQRIVRAIRDRERPPDRSG